MLTEHNNGSAQNNGAEGAGEELRKENFPQFGNYGKNMGPPEDPVFVPQIENCGKSVFRNSASEPPPTVDDFEKVKIIGALNQQPAGQAKGKPSDSAKEAPPEQSKRGRKLQFDEARRQQFCMMLRIGLPRYLAAAQCGVSPQTITRTMKQSASFRKQVLEAETLFEVSPLLTLLQAARKSWRAAKYVVENYHPHASVRNRKRKAKNKEAGKKMQDIFDVFDHSKGKQSA